MRRVTRRSAAVLIGLASAGASAGCALIADLSQFNGYVDAAASDGSVESSTDSRAPDELPAIGDTGAAVDAGEGGSPEDAADADTATALADGAASDAPNPLGASWCSANVDKATVLCADFDERSSDKFLTFPYGSSWTPNDQGGTDGLDRADYALGSGP